MNSYIYFGAISLVILFIGILGFVDDNFGFNTGITGMVTKTEEMESDPVNETFKTNTVSLWTPEKDMDLGGVGITGNVSGNGTASAYLVYGDNKILINSHTLENESVNVEKDCQETCSLDDLNQTEYFIRYELEGDVSYEVDSIDYSSQSITEEPASKPSPKKQIVVGKSVQWEGKVSSDRLELPKQSQNISVRDDALFQESSDTSLTVNEKNDSKVINVSEYEKPVVSYTTPGPQSIEKNTPSGKEITISASDELNYQDVLAHTEISEELEIKEKSQLKVYWKNENQSVNFDTYDTNNNTYIDKLEWTVPHLSNQTYEVIYLTDTQHLDENRSFIENIYNETKEKDGTWSTEISSNHYIRATFDQNLTSGKFIALYPNITSGDPSIELYEKNSTTLITESSSLTSNEYNKIHLDNLNNTQNTFDLKILNGSIELDHIIDSTSEIQIESLYPTDDIQISKNKSFNVTLNVSCTGLDCGSVNVTLDPEVGDSGSVTLSDSGDDYDFDEPTKTSGSAADLRKDIGWHPLNGAEQVATGISTSNFDSVSCDPEDGRTYSTNSVSYDQPYNTVICMKTNKENYVKYKSQSSCCAEITIDWEITHVPGAGEKGTIPTNTSATPFYTNKSSNPFNINFDDSQSKQVTFRVNATGDLNTTHEFFAYANSTSNMSISNETTHWNVSIIERIKPEINITYPTNDTEYNVVVNDLNYTITESYPKKCWYSKDGGNTNSSTVQSGINFTDVESTNGQNNWTVYCNDTFGNLGKSKVIFNQSTPEISLEKTQPSGDFDAIQNDLSNIIFNLSCTNEDCIDINMTLFYKFTKSDFFEGFEEGNLDDWTLNNNNMNINPGGDVRSGSYSAGSWGDGTVNGEIIVCEGGCKPNKSEFYWYEDSSQTGFSSSFLDSNGNRVISSGTNNPQWELEDGDGSPQIYGGDGYNRWIYYSFDFDWNNCEYDYYFEDTQSGHTETGTRSLDSCQNIEKFRVSDNYFGVSADHTVFDDISFNMTNVFIEKISTNETKTPFYTNRSTNPFTIKNLSKGEDKKVDFYFNATGKPPETYEFYAYSRKTDNANINDETTHWNVTIIDINDPVVNITYPKENTYNTDVNSINYTATDSNPDKCWYSTDARQFNTSPIEFGVNFTDVDELSGQNNWTVYCRDTSGNIGKDSVSFYENVSSVVVELINPRKDSEITKDLFFDVKVNVSCSEVNDCGGINVTLDQGGTVSTDSSSTPFWTKKSPNPYPISLSAGESKVLNFPVNASGSTGSYQFFSYVNGTGELSGRTKEWNMEILPPPDIDSSLSLSDDEVGMGKSVKASSSISIGTDTLDSVWIFIDKPYEKDDIKRVVNESGALVEEEEGVYSLEFNHTSFVPGDHLVRVYANNTQNSKVYGETEYSVEGNFEVNIVTDKDNYTHTEDVEIVGIP